MMKTRPQTVPARRPPTPDPRDVICPHQHFKYDIIDRDILSRKQHLNLLCTPKGYRWVVMKRDPTDMTPDESASHPCKVVKKKPGKTYVHNILAELWNLLTPEMITRLKGMLMVEFGLSEEAAVEFICHSRHDTLRTAHRIKRKQAVDEVEQQDDLPAEDLTLPRLIIEPKLCDKSQFAVGIDPCHIKEFSRIVSTKFSEYVVAMMCARRNNRHRRMAEVVLNGLCNLTGENTTLDNPKNRLHKILTTTSDRVALWLAQNMDDEDNKRDRRRKKEDDALKKKRREKQKEQERRRKEKERMTKEIERNNKRREKEEEGKEKQKQEEQDKKKAEKEKRRQEIEKFREEDKKKKQDEKNKAKEDGDKKKPEKKRKGEAKDENQKARPKSAQAGGSSPSGRRAKTEGQKSASADKSSSNKSRQSGTRGTAKPAGKQGNEGARKPGNERAGQSQQKTAKPSGNRPGGNKPPSQSSNTPSATPSKSKSGAPVKRTQPGGPQSGDGNAARRGRGEEGKRSGTSNDETGQPAEGNATPSTRENAPPPARPGAGTPDGETDQDQPLTNDAPSHTETVPTGASGEGTDTSGPESDRDTFAAAPTSGDAGNEGAEVQGGGAGAPGEGTGVQGGGAGAPGEGIGVRGEGAGAPGEGVGVRGEGARAPGEGTDQPTAASSSPRPIPPGAPGKGAETEAPLPGDMSAPTAALAAGPDDGTKRDGPPLEGPDRPAKDQLDRAPLPGKRGSAAPGVQKGLSSVPAAEGVQGTRGPGVQHTAPSSDKSLEERIIAVTTSQIGDTKPVPTPRQETLQDILNKELEKRIEPKDKETSEVIREVASRTATWIDQNVKDAEIEYGSRDKLAHGTTPVSQKPKGPLYVLRKIDPVKRTYEVRTATYTEAGKKIRTLRRRASGRNVTSTPIDPSDPKMWAKWAENASEMADDWGHWIDKTIQDAEDKAVQYQAKAKEGNTQPEDEEDWNRFVESTNEDALTWRRMKKSFDEAAKEWKLYVH